MSLLATSICAGLLLGQTPQVSYIERQLQPPGGGEPRLFLWVLGDRMPTPKLSPKRFGENKIPFEFDWLTPAYARLQPNKVSLRFRVYSQERRQEGDLAPQVAQTLLRLFDRNFWQLGIDHNPVYNDGIIDVYLCWGGQAGGEQLYDQEVVRNRPVKVNTIYIYDLASFTEPVEKLREVAHEYGHASLPPIGGFDEPEHWANGYLGEKINLAYLRDGLAKGWFTPDDTMGATQAQLDLWVKSNVEPLVAKAASDPPSEPRLAGKDKASMDAYIGLAAYMNALLPPKTFTRSMALTGSIKATDYPAGIALAVEEASQKLQIPAYLLGKKIWVPTSDGTVTGATVLKKKGGWAQVQPKTPELTIVPKKR
ncbi:MAG TPA: hypothetical protein VGE01_04350 [Fimbriimonas sp.]